MQSIPKDDQVRNLQARIGDSLFRAAKIEAARRDASLQDWISAAVKEKLDRDNPRWLRDLPEPQADAA